MTTKTTALLGYITYVEVDLTEVLRINNKTKDDIDKITARWNGFAVSFKDGTFVEGAMHTPLFPTFESEDSQKYPDTIEIMEDDDEE